MEEEICQYHTFGFCRFKDDCKKKHLTTECEDLYNCKKTKSCNKRHPKRCKRYSSEKCRFEHECAYKHQKPPVNEDHEELKEKVKVLEKVLHAKTRKVLGLKTQVEALNEEKS